MLQDKHTQVKDILQYCSLLSALRKEGSLERERGGSLLYLLPHSLQEGAKEISGTLSVTPKFGLGGVNSPFSGKK